MTQSPSRGPHLRVFGWSDGKGGVHHYRIREPLRGLRRLGHTVATGVHLADPENYDVILVRALHDRFGSLGWQHLASKGKHLLVYDLDDDLWAWKPHTKSYLAWTDERLARAERNIVAADLVTTTNKRLASILAQLNPHVAILPNTVPAKLLDFNSDLPDSPFIVGWEGAEQHLDDLELIYAPVFRFMLKHTDVELHLWGPQQIGDFPNGLAERIRYTPWQSSVWQYYHSLRMHVGLAPLNMLDPFNQTKSDIRIREHSALGIPVIASEGITYRGSVDHGVTGVLAQPGTWENWLEFFYDNRLSLEHIGYNARRKACEWTTEINAHLWEEAYERAAAAKFGTAAGEREGGKERTAAG